MFIYTAGRTYTLNITEKIRVGHSMSTNPLRIVLEKKENLHYDIFIHDPKYFYVSRNPNPGHPSVRKHVNPEMLPYAYPFTLTEVEELNVPDDPCNPDPSFNYRDCISESISKKVGCSVKWGKSLTKDLPLCGSLAQFW